MQKLLRLFKTKAAPARRPGRASSVRRAPLRTDADWVEMREPQRAQDLVLADHVLVWLQQLPQGLRPSELCAQYPRVANRIALCWSDAALTDYLFDGLMVNHRGKRNGFPPPVAVELMRLRLLHARRKGIAQTVPTWDTRLLAVSDR
jgi:hypothetical protein